MTTVDPRIGQSAGEARVVAHAPFAGGLELLLLADVSVSGHAEVTGAGSVSPATCIRLPGGDGHPSGTLVAAAKVVRVDEVSELAVRGRKAVVLVQSERQELTLEELLEDYLSVEDMKWRDRLLEFLVEAVTELQERPGAAAATDLRVARLHLRTPLTKVNAKDHAAPQAGYADRFVAISPHQFWVQGWLVDRESPIQTIFGVSPEGERVELASHMTRHRRPDVEEALGISPNAPDRTIVAFSAHVTCQIPSPPALGWKLEWESANGRLFEVSLPSPEDDRGAIPRDIVEQAMARALADDRQNQILLSSLGHQLESQRSAKVDRTIRLGQAPAPLLATAIVAVGDRPDLIEHHLANAAGAHNEIEFLFVCTDPSSAGDFEDRLHQLDALYDASVTGVILDTAVTGAVGATLVADLAAADVLIVLAGDAMPSEPDWYRRLAAVVQRPGTGAAGPVTLYEDDSIREAGLTVRAREDGRLEVLSLLRGFHRDFMGAASPGWQGLPSTCMAMTKDTFASVGGFSPSFATAAAAGVDMSFRVRELGLDVVLCDDVHVYSLGLLPDPFADDPFAVMHDSQALADRHSARARPVVEGGHEVAVSM